MQHTSDGSLSPFEPYDEMNIVDGESHGVEESMRVMYEDPVQREEKKRLMSLFETQGDGDGTQSGMNGGGGGTKKSRTRRSARVAGF